jgi:uncharacterized damage-inducible protein DinB
MRAMRTVQDFLAYYRRQRSWSRALVAAVPEECFDWRPSPEAFSCGELVVHLIQSERFWCRLLVEAAEGRPYDPFGLPGTARERMLAFRQPNVAAAGAAAAKFGPTFAACLESWTRVQAKTEEELARITPEQLVTVEVEHPLLTMRAPLWEMLVTMVGHEIHHRGQLSAYLKTLGIEQPPLLGL